MEPGLKKLIDHFRTQTAVASIIKKKPQAVQKWKRVPACHVLTFSRESELLLRPYDLRPDLYPDPNWVQTVSLPSN